MLHIKDMKGHFNPFAFLSQKKAGLTETDSVSHKNMRLANVPNVYHIIAIIVMIHFCQCGTGLYIHSDSPKDE